MTGMDAQALECLLIGNGSLLIRCGELLRAAGARLVEIVTEEEAVERWAAGVGVTARRFDPGLPSRLGPGHVDYVFSIGNLRVLPPEWLALARRLAVNFHDGPLPEYRGLHVTSWALLNREPRHGVTWHIAMPEIDAGPVLEEERFEIAPDETALTLNVKCYDAGARAFARLVDAIRDDRVVARPVSASAVTHYYGRAQRPEAAGFVDWARPIDECEALVRALDFGSYLNPLCTPWFLRDSRVARVDLETVARVRAGHVEPFEPLADALRRRITACHETWSGLEPGWARHCRALQPLSLTTGADPSPTPSRAEFPLGDALAGQPIRAAATILVWMARAFDQPSFDVAYRGAVLDSQLAGLEPWFETLPPLRVEVPLEGAFEGSVAAVMADMAAHDGRGTFLRDLVRRFPDLRGRDEGRIAQDLRVAITIGEDAADRRDLDAALVVHLSSDGRRCEWRGDPQRLHTPLAVLQSWCRTFLLAAQTAPDLPVWKIPVVTPIERERLLEEWNPPAPLGAAFRAVPKQFDDQVSRSPEATAIVTWRRQWSYRELDGRAMRIAGALRARGVGPGAVVGIHLERSFDMIATLMAVMRTGAAYLPLDPTYPSTRLAFMLDDSAAALVVTQSTRAPGAPAVSTPVLSLDALDGLADQDTAAPFDAPALTPTGLAYLIYTSGSTGQPKGVMIEHGNVASFFTAMDSRLTADPPGVWLAVTSLSFDISVLELLWTLCRGFTVVLQEHGTGTAAGPAAERPIDLSLFYFASDESSPGTDRYRLLLEGVRFADRHGFEAVWTPERHFHAFGGLYPNPAITSAAIATITERVKIRAGSIVLPLHHPVRVAEDWSVVDNLSNGRVGVAFASGWHPNDFVLAPHQHDRAKQVTFENLALVRRLWRGESVTLEGPGGRDVVVRTLPRPVQAELPFWITTAGNPETFRQAGEAGANVLTHLLGQTIDEVAVKIRTYRDARRAAGHAGDGQVTLMLHTFVGQSDDEVHDVVKAPMMQYLGSALNLVKQHAWSFPAFKGRRTPGAESTDELFRDLSAEDLEGLLEHAFERYFEGGGLFGSIDTCVAAVERVRSAGVDEIACLIDFGVPAERVLAGLDALGRLRQRIAGRQTADREPSIPDAIHRYGVTHFQCTPSMASLLLADAGGPAALGRLRHLLVGGEVLAAPLAARLLATGAARVTNMYGPTETTVWSLTHDLTADVAPVPIGRPIDGTRAYVCDARGELVPIGSEGELYLGGPGVARGYHGRPQLTADRFVADPFGAPPTARMYRTGDRVRFRQDGILEFLGRSDQQIKLRGHRIELGEVEAALRTVPGVGDAVVALREDTPGDHRLVGYVTAVTPASVTAGACRAALRDRLPAVMVPAAVVVLDALPVTPNGKIDRSALPAPRDGAARQGQVATSPADDVQRQVAGIWRDVLHLDAVGVDDNFFDLGGHSLLTVQVAHRLGEALGRALPITDLFRYPTIRSLARHLSAPDQNAGMRAADARAALRRSARSRRHDR